MKPAGRISLALLIISFGMNNASLAQDKIGEQEFRVNCAVCHGNDGKGNGPVAELLTVATPDLTTMTKRNGGTFPEVRVRELIDGRESVAAHGTRDMPVWGYEYSKRAVEYYRDFYEKQDAERFVTMRVDGLVGYLRSIQQ